MTVDPPQPWHYKVITVKHDHYYHCKYDRFVHHVQLTLKCLLSCFGKPKLQITPINKIKTIIP